MSPLAIPIILRKSITSPMIGQTISHYRILSKLGEGGMGVVYLAEDTVLGRHVAIKTLTDGGLSRQHFRTRFLREARAVSALSHANIGTIYDYGETPQGHPYIVMEFVQGQTLADLISEGKLTLERAVEIIIDVARALAEAHRHGIVHRDIKPSNIAVNANGQVKVLDFGLAKQLDTVPTENGDAAHCVNTQTREGVMIGTPMYVSPEQALGVPVDARSDLFSLGSVLYECVAGHPAFSGLSPIEICAKVIRDDPPRPSSFNPKITSEIDRVTLKSLAKKPDERYQSAELCIEDLRAAERSLKKHFVEQKISPVVESLEASLHKPKTRGFSNFSAVLTRSRVVIGVILLLVVVAAIFAAIQLWRLQPYEPSVEAKRRYEEGVRALQDGTYFKASRMMDQAIQNDKGFALAHARNAEALAELGYFEKANAEIYQANLLVNNSSLSIVDQLHLRAINSTIFRDFNGAVESYRQMVSLAADADRPHILVDLGRMHEKNEDLKSAITNYQEAINLDSEYAPAFLRLGALHGRMQEFIQGKEALEKALALYQLQSNPEGIAEALYQQGVLLTGKGDLVPAREPLERALQIVRTFSNPSQEVRTLLQLSTVLRQTRDPKTAELYAIEAIDVANSNGLSDLKTQGIIELGYTFFFREEIPTAENHFKQALNLAQGEKERVTQAKAEFALGSLYIQQDDADTGIPYIRRALPFYEQNKYLKEMMQCQTLLGQAYALKGNLNEALKAFEEQLNLSRKLNIPLQMGLSHKSIGTVLGNLEKYPEALQHIEQSYSIFSSSKLELYVGYTLTSRAEMKWKLGRYEDAVADLNYAMSLAEHQGGSFKQLWGRLHAVKAPMALSQRDFQTAIKSAEEAIKLDPSRTRHPAIEAMSTLGLAQFLSGERRRGKHACEQAVQMAGVSGNPRLMLVALLALAEIMMESGDAWGALANAVKAQRIIERSDQVESQWRALLIAGRANQRLGNSAAARETLLSANRLLTGLQQQWGNADYDNYLNRKDIQQYRDSLLSASSVVR